MSDHPTVSSPALSVEPASDEPAARDADHPFRTPSTDRYAEGRLVGGGGMGRVTAVHDHRLRRDVALKTLEPARAEPGDEARLCREAWITAQLDHPSIVPVHDAGVAPDGRAYYTMRLVRGRTLGEAIRAAGSPAERLGLLRHFLATCEAVGYAHDLGIVHRDLKPANVLVGEHGETQVIDWGLACPVGEAADGWRGRVLARDATRTAAGAVVGTPAYMSPEQAAGAEPSPAADVWSLGALLHVILSGEPPFGRDEATRVLARLRDEAAPPLAERAPGVPTELCAIADRALRRAPAERYPSAVEMARDVARYLDGRLVGAYVYRPLDHLRRFVRAWRAPLTVASLALLALVVVGGVAWQRTVAERNRAVAAEAATVASLRRADRSLSLALVEQARQAAARDARPEAELLAAHALVLAESPEARGVLAGFGVEWRPRLIADAEAPRCRVARLSRDGERLLCLEDDALSLWAGWPPALRWRQPGQPQDAVVLGTGRVAVTEGRTTLRVLDADTGEPVGEALEVGASQHLVAQATGFVALVRPVEVDVREVATGRRVRHQPCGAANHVVAAFSADDARLAVLCGDGAVAVGPPLGALARIGRVPFATGPAEGCGLAWTPDGSALVVGTLDGTLGLLDVASAELRWWAKTDTGGLRELAVSPDGAWVAAVGDRGGAHLWHAASGAPATRFPAGQGRQVRFGADGTLRTAGRSLRRWALPARLPPRWLAVGSGLSSAEPSPAGDTVALTRGDGVLSVRGLDDGRPLADAEWQLKVLKPGAFTLDGGRYLVSGIGDDSLQVFETAGWQATAALGRQAYRRVVALAGDLVLASSYGAGVDAWRLADGRPFEWFRGEAVVADLAVDPAGGYAVALGEHDGRVFRVAAATPAMEEVHRDPGAVALDVSADGRTLVVGRRDGVRLVDLATGGVRALEEVGEVLLDVALSADERWVAAGALDGTAFVWSAADGGLRARLRGHAERVVAVAFGRDELVTAGWDGVARRWDLRALDHDARALVTQIEDAWGLRLEDLLAAPQ